MNFVMKQALGGKFDVFFIFIVAPQNVNAYVCKCESDYVICFFWSFFPPTLLSF